MRGPADMHSRLQGVYQALRVLPVAAAEGFNPPALRQADDGSVLPEDLDMIQQQVRLMS